MSEQFQKISDCILNGDDEEITSLIKEALDSGINAKDILNKGLIPAMDIVGPKMESGEMFIPEVLMAADVMKAGLEEIKPLLSEGDISTAGTVVIGTVQGDLHDIGKNLVAMMLEVSGFRVVDIGVDKDINSFLEACEKEKPDVVGLSALLTTTMSAMKETVAAIKDKFKDIKVIVGGAPVSCDFAKSINSDGYSDDAGGAVMLCKSLVK